MYYKLAIALITSSKANCLQQRFAIALSHPKNSELLAAALRYRISHIPRANCLQQRFAIAPHIPKSDTFGALC